MKVILSITNIFLIAFCCFDVRTANIFPFERSNNEVDIKDSDVLCANNKTKCHSTGTCCQTKFNGYHCCSYKNAVCCSDHYHCCPEDSTCDIEKKRCTKNIVEAMEWKVEEDDKRMVPLSKSKNLLAPSANTWSSNDLESSPLGSESMCPNNKTKCKDTKTCCVTLHGNYYCCPHKNAVCCSDKWLCCAEGQTCDVKHKKCLDSRFVPQAALKSSSAQPPIELSSTNMMPFSVQSFLGLFSTNDKRCGSTQKSCPGEQKCCAMEGDKFGCCKYRKGVCCPDFVKCCPHGTTCDIKNHICTAKPDDLIPVALTVDQVLPICPDNKTQCADGETCCSVGDVLYGCCPMKDATCCSDKTSCCPHNKKCDVEHKRCVNNDGVTDVTTSVEIKTSATSNRKSLERFLNKIGLKTVCPDKSNCEGTCCEISDNRYGCCPYEMATCCPDMRTCCPSHMQCLNGGCS